MRSRNVDPVARNCKAEFKRLSPTRGKRRCVCGHRQRVQKSDTRFGPFHIYGETCARTHESYCPLSKAKFTEERSTKFGFRFFGLVTLMNVVLVMSFQVTSGAGGHSMAPTFMYYPTVDRRSDPAFQIIDSFPSEFMTHKIRCRSRCSSCLGTSLKVTLKKIESLVFEGKSSPKAVDAQNKSWLHVMLSVVRASF